MEPKSYELQVKDYVNHLRKEERSAATIRQYRRDILNFLVRLGPDKFSKEAVIEYKKELEKKYRPVSVNTKLSALNSFFSFIGRSDLRLKFLKIQKKAYCPAEKELSREEYLRLIKAAERRKNEKLAMLLQTMGGTGIRVSELRYITAEAVERGEAVIQLKGKTRTILLPKKLQRALEEYMQKEGITEGPVFITRTGRPLNRSNVWKMMKGLCREAGVDERKVFPHNLRHLFARCFYSIDRDIAMLADILGHSSINTTRVYIITSGAEHRRRLDKLGLVV